MRAHFYDRATGVFLGSFSGHESDLVHNTPEGAGVHEGDVPDPGACKLCLHTGVLLPYSRPARVADPMVEAEATVLALEARHVRALREAVLAIARGAAVPAGCVALLEQHDKEIALLRPKLVRHSFIH